MLFVKKTCLCILLSVLVFSPFITTTNLISTEIGFNVRERRSHPFSEVHAPVIIVGDDEFKNQGWAGEGTEEKPYIISGLTINSNETGIHVANTSKFFEIRQCRIESNESTGIGILFENVTSGSVIDSQVQKKYDGIRLVKSLECRIYNTTSQNNTYNGFALYQSNFTILENNTAMANYYGIKTDYSESVEFYDNTAIHNRDIGILIQYSPKAHLAYNVGNDNGDEGIVLFRSDYSILTYNTGNGNRDQGFELMDSYNCRIVKNSATENGLDGYDVRRSFHCIFDENMAYNNSRNGFFLENNNNCTFARNLVYNNSRGFWSEGGFKLSFLSNIIYQHSWEGIRFEGLKDCSFSNNTVFRNTLGGFASAYSHRCNFTFNRIIENPGIGFRLTHGNNSRIFNNTISGSQFGIFIYRLSFLNEFVDNRIFNNSNNAEDNSSINCWDDNYSMGNYWDDYSGTGHYNISGTAGGVDRWPRLFELRGPEIQFIIQNPEIRRLSESCQISVYVIDENEVQEVILTYRVISGSWVNQSMSFNGTWWITEIPPLESGDLIEFRIFARDVLDNWGFSETLFYHAATTVDTETITTTETSTTSTRPLIENVSFIWISVLISGIGVVFLGALYLRKRSLV